MENLRIRKMTPSTSPEMSSGKGGGLKGSVRGYKVLSYKGGNDNLGQEQ